MRIGKGLPLIVVNLRYMRTQKFNYKSQGQSYEKRNFKIKKVQVTVLTFILFIISYVTLHRVLRGTLLLSVGVNSYVNL